MTPSTAPPVPQRLGDVPARYQRAEAAGRLAADVPVNHSDRFAPVPQPTLDTGAAALTLAALAWLGRPAGAEGP